MIHLGLIGYPLGHSLSPKIHAAALKACGLKGDYSLFPIVPDDMQALKELLASIRAGEITGLNVTIPHKQNVISLLDKLTDTAKSIGAVNTIYLRDNKLIGHNADAQGFLTDLNQFISKSQSKIANRKSAVVLGAGGSARAVVYALINDGWKVTIAARRIEQAQQLTNSFPNYQLQITNFENIPARLHFPISSSPISSSPISSLSLIANTTPLGMAPNINQSPLPEKLSLSSNTLIYDLVYNPRETKLVKDARAHGLQATTGLGMLIEQAALSFEIWTGHNPSRETMRLSVE